MTTLSEIKTHNDGFNIWDFAKARGDFGSSLCGYIDISHAELVEAFGESGPTDDYKVDAEWWITDGTRVATLYNYKDGPNYNDGAGSVESIRDWHIGGFNENAVQLLRDLFPESDVRSGY